MDAFDENFNDYYQYPDYYEHNIEAGFDMFDRIPGTEFLESDERADAFALFYDAFVETGGDREAFFDYMGLDSSDFPWADWLDWMGYE